ncbi:MAG TPA: hypothetical protein VH877_13045 [Polyangia bacterium]|jgi:hypothetical protein|nr:hypothetical protein [Polyangia bacterium]
MDPIVTVAAAPRLTDLGPWTLKADPAPPRETEAHPTAPAAPGLLDLLLRNETALNQLLLDDRRLTGTLQKLLGVTAFGLCVHGLVVGLVAQPVAALGTDGFVQGRPLLWLPLTFVGALIGALTICLPSFYFYTQLSGLDASFRLVTAQAVRVLAKTAVLLLGVAPFYAALALSAATGLVDDRETVVRIGFAAPFVVGLWGIAALRRSFAELSQVLPITHERRGNFLTRMVLAWGAVYSVVAPVAFWRLGEALGRIF